MAAQWCIECWNAFKQRTVATRVIEDDPYCAGCAVRLGFEAAPEVSGRTLGTARNGMDSSPLAAPDAAASLKAGEAEISGESPISPEFAGSDPEASPGSFAKAIKKAFLPKAAKGEAMRKEVDWKQYDALKKGEGEYTHGQIAEALGVSSPTLYARLKERGAEPKPKFNKRQKKGAGAAPVKPEPSGNVTLAVPESALDRFFARLPITRKVEIFTRELSSLEA